jgi:hypothetical protein
MEKRNVVAIDPRGSSHLLLKESIETHSMVECANTGIRTRKEWKACDGVWNIGTRVIFVKY